MRRVVTFVVDDERDEDLLTWLAAQANKSAALREAIRTAIRLQSGASQEAVVREAVAGELAACLPDLLAATVRDALAAYQLAPTTSQEREPGEEDAVMAARLDSQPYDID